MRINQEESKLIERIIRRDERALLKIYKLYRDYVFRFIYRRLKDRAQAEELTQDVFFDFIEGLRSFRGEASLKTFIFSIARNKVIDEIRKKRISKVLFSALPQFIVEGLATFLLDEEIEKKQLQEKIRKVFETLPNDYRLVLRLKYIDEEKVKEIAKKMSLSFKATESLIFRARKAFIKIFSSYENYSVKKQT